MTTDQVTIRAQLAHHVRAAGLRKTADAINLDPATLSRFIAGKGTLRAHHIEALCQQLGLTLTIERPDNVGG